jgi:hypothetical protein
MLHASVATAVANAGNVGQLIVTGAGSGLMTGEVLSILVL